MPLALQGLAYLTALPTLPGLKQKLTTQLSVWEALSATHKTCNVRQHLRWQLLYKHWQHQQNAIFEQGLRRGAFSEDVIPRIQHLVQEWQPPAAPTFTNTTTQSCLALFITGATPESVMHGEAWPLILRALEYTPRFPPLHLSARFADAAILSAGQMAFEALQNWLAEQLHLSHPFPLWAHLALPEHLRVTDESASLAFMGSTLQKICGVSRVQAFSGRVLRDSGQIEQVAGFDLPYGKLEAAYDQGAEELYLPVGLTPRALPDAGITLKTTAYGWDYRVGEGPVLKVFPVKNLQELYTHGFAQQPAQDFLPLLRHLPRHGFPDLNHWKPAVEHWLPAPLLQQVQSLYEKEAIDLASLEIAFDRWCLELHQSVALHGLSQSYQERMETQTAEKAYQTQEALKTLLSDYHRFTPERLRQLLTEYVPEMSLIHELKQLAHAPDLKAKLRLLPQLSALARHLSTQTEPDLSWIRRLLSKKPLPPAVFDSRFSGCFRRGLVQWQGHQQCPVQAEVTLTNPSAYVIVERLWNTTHYLKPGESAHWQHRFLPDTPTLRVGTDTLTFLDGSFSPLEVKRSFPERLHSGETFEVVYTLINPNPYPLEIRGSGLPNHLGACSLRDVVVQETVLAPGPVRWEAFSLDYCTSQGEAYTLTLPAEERIVSFNERLPAHLRHTLYQRVNADLKAAVSKGAGARLHLHGPRGSGKRQLLQQLLPDSRIMMGDPQIKMPFQGLEQWVSQLQLPFSLEDATPQVYRALRNALQAQKTPLLVFRIEYLDQETLHFLRFLCLHTHLTLAFTSETETLPDALRELSVQQHKIPPLTADELGQALRLKFPTKAAHFQYDNMVKRLLHWTQGQLLQVQTCLRDWVSGGDIYVDTTLQQWTHRPLESFPVPAALESRLIQNCETVRETEPAFFEQTVVWGVAFTLEHLRQWNPGVAESRLQRFLTHAESTGLLQWQQNQWQWRLALYPELYYPRIPTLRRQQLHQQMAVYEQQHQRRVPVLARHYLNSHTPELALSPCLVLAENYLAQGEFNRAQEWLAPVMPNLERFAFQVPSYYRGFLFQGQIYRQTLNQQQARICFQKAITAAQRAGDTRVATRSYLEMASVSPPKARAKALQAAKNLLEHFSDSPLTYELEFQWGVYLSESNSYGAAQPHFYRALGACVPNSISEAQVLAYMGYEHIKRGEASMAEPLLLRALDIFRKARQRQGQAAVHKNLGSCAFYAQDTEKALYHFTESQRYFEASGDKLGACQVRHNRALLAESRRNYDRAETLLTQNIAAAQRLENHALLGFSYNQRASVALKQRQFTLAQQSLQAASTALNLSNDARGLAYHALLKGMLALFERRLPEAQQMLSIARKRLNPLQDVMGQDMALLQSGHAYWLAGDQAQAGDFYTRCLRSREQLDKTGYEGLERIYHALGLWHYHQGEITRAQRELEKTLEPLARKQEAFHLAIAYHNLAHINAAGRTELLQQRDMILALTRHPDVQKLASHSGLYAMLD